MNNKDVAIFEEIKKDALKLISMQRVAAEGNNEEINIRHAFWSDYIKTYDKINMLMKKYPFLPPPPKFFLNPEQEKAVRRLITMEN